MSRRSHRPVPREKFYEFGYWAYPDPATAVRALLARQPRLLGSFEETYEEEDGSPGLLSRWAEREGVSVAVRRVLESAYECAGGHHFDAAEVASGVGPPHGDADGWRCTLYAYRRDGWIHYRTEGDGTAPMPTRIPLTIQQAFEVVAGGDLYAITDQALERLALRLGDRPSTRAALERWLDSGAWAVRLKSTFYDFTDLQETLRASVLEALVRQFPLASD